MAVNKRRIQMKSWRMLRYVFLVVVVALLLTSGVGAQSSCEIADSLREAKLYEDAATAYAAVLENASLNVSQRACALAGIKELHHAQAEELYNLGKIYEEQNQLNDARSAYIDALKKDPNFSDVQNALARISDPFAEVRTLANNGLYTEAVDRFKKVVENNPNISVPEDLNYLFGGKISFWRWLKLQNEPWIRPFGEIVVLIAIVGLVLIAIYHRIWPRIKGFFKPPLKLWTRIKGFFKHPLKLWTRIKGFLKPQLKLNIEDFDKGATGLDIGKGMKTLVEESYTQLGEGHSRLHLMDKPLDKIEIPVDITGIIGAPYFKIVSQLIQWAFPPKLYTLSGSLQTSGNLGAGLTLRLVNRRTGEIVANYTIWQKAFDPTMTQQVASKSTDPTTYYRLAKLAAIWTFYQLGQIEKTDFSSLGTQNWLSYAYLRAGVFWALEDYKVKARQLYNEALNRDIKYRSALFNLGYLDIEDREYDRAIERLSHAKELSSPKDYLWYLATYQLAAAYHYKSMLYKAKKDLDQAEIESSELVEKIDSTISEPQSSLEAREEMLKQVLQLFKLNARIMHAAIIADQDKIVDAEEEVNRIKNEYHNIFSYRVHYNFACYYSIVGNKTKDRDKRESIDAYKKALYHLEYALERGGDIINWAQKDPSLEGVRNKETFGKLIKKYSPEKKRTLVVS
jgi:tetratricopeptide (TPR) repeat protein